MVYRTKVANSAGSIEIDVHYRVRPWGVDLDEVFIAGTDNKLPLTSREYFWITKEISTWMATNKDHPWTK